MKSAQTTQNSVDPPKPPTADEIADMADRGKDVSRFFTNTGKMMPPIQRVSKGGSSGKED